MLNLGNKFKEFKKAAGTICVCALLALVVGLSGCTGAEPADPIQDDAPASANEKAELKALQQNPLELIENREEVTVGNLRESVSHSTIDGLYDEAVEAKINARILEVVEQQRTSDLPPYRGIKTKVTEDHVLVEKYVTMTVQGSYNNILSATVYRSMSYAHKDDLWQKEEQGYYDNTIYASDTIPMVFDLNTGEEVQLSDVFHDDVEYMNVLNHWMDQHLAQSAATEEGWYPSGGELDLKLVGPFKGLPEDQKFYLTPYGLALVFGPEDTQFTSEYGFYTSTVSIPFHDLDGMTALAYRFMDEEKDLYTSDEQPVYSLLNMTGDMTEGAAEYYTKDGVHYNLSLQYPEGLPDNVEAKLWELGTFNESISQELKDSLTLGASGYYDVSVYAFCVGGYISLNFAESAYGWDENGDQCYDHYQNAYYGYYADTGEPIELADLFDEQCDPEQVLRNGMYSYQRKLSDLYDDPPAEDAEIWKTVDEKLRNVTGFAVDTTSLNLVSSWEDPDTGKIRAQWTSVPYEDIGCQYMTIFD